MRKGIVSALALVFCLGVSACGSSSSKPPARVVKPPPVTKASFDAQVSSICTRADNAYVAAKTASGKVAVIQHYMTVFRSVQAPKDLQSTYSSYVSVLAKELADLKRGDLAGLLKLRNGLARPLVLRLGATACTS